MSSGYFQLLRNLSSLAVDSPYVATTRIARFCDPAAIFSRRNQAEFYRMFAEKQMAAMEASMALWRKGAFPAWWMFPGPGFAGGPRRRKPSLAAGTRAMNAALRPYRKRAHANARRLRRR